MTVTIAISFGAAGTSRGGSFRALRVNRVIEEPVHHLFPGLFAETDGLRRVGILRILSRIVEMRDGFDLRSLRNSDRRLRVVIDLPAEIIVWHREQDLRSPVGIYRAVE